MKYPFEQNQIYQNAQKFLQQFATHFSIDLKSITEKRFEREPDQAPYVVMKIPFPDIDSATHAHNYLQSLGETWLYLSESVLNFHIFPEPNARRNNPYIQVYHLENFDGEEIKTAEALASLEAQPSQTPPEATLSTDFSCNPDAFLKVLIQLYQTLKKLDADVEIRYHTHDQLEYDAEENVYNYLNLVFSNAQNAMVVVGALRKCGDTFFIYDAEKNSNTVVYIYNLSCESNNVGFQELLQLDDENWNLDALRELAQKTSNNRVSKADLAIDSSKAANRKIISWADLVKAPGERMHTPAFTTEYLPKNYGCNLDNLQKLLTPLVGTITINIESMNRSIEKWNDSLLDVRITIEITGKELQHLLPILYQTMSQSDNLFNTGALGFNAETGEITYTFKIHEDNFFYQMNISQEIISTFSAKFFQNRRERLHLISQASVANYRYDGTMFKQPEEQISPQAILTNRLGFVS